MNFNSEGYGRFTTRRHSLHISASSSLIRVLLVIPFVKISIRNSIELSRSFFFISFSNCAYWVKTSKALMRHTILVKHIYCAIYFISFRSSAFRKLRHFTAKRAKHNFLCLFLLVQRDAPTKLTGNKFGFFVGVARRDCNGLD